jgi:hypothetical protein
MADPSIRNDVGAGALLATVNTVKGAALPCFRFGPPTTSAQGTRSYGSISRLDGAGREHFGPAPPARRSTGGTFT